MKPTTDVLIIGAGPTGLTLAIDLARRGVALRIVDALDGPVRGSKGKGLQPRTQEILDDLGIVDDIRAAGGEYPPIRAYADNGDVVWEGAMGKPRPASPDVPYPSVLMVPQWLTERILAAKLSEYGVQVEYGSALTDLTQDENGVQTNLGAAKYLVGADGGRSVVRRKLKIPFLGETFETERMAIADVQIPGLSRDVWHAWGDFGSEGLRLGLCPLPSTEDFQLTAPLAAEEAPDLSLDGVRELIAERTGRTGRHVTAATWHSLYRVNIRLAEKFRVGRAFLAGDAAHAHSPAGGQGLNTGVQDAYNLGWKLAAVLAGAPERLLDTYEAERLPVAADVLGLSTLPLRKGNVASEDESVPQRGKDTDQLDLSYPAGPLSVDARLTAGPLHAGDRAPDAPLGGGARLFDLFRGPHLTLLLFDAARRTPVGGGAGAVTIVAKGSFARPGEYLDTDGHAFASYGIDPADGGFVVVRPDGYVGLVADLGQPTEVDRYLAATLGVRMRTTIE